MGNNVRVLDENCEANNISIYGGDEDRIIYLIEQGPQGKAGPPSTSNITEPFYLVSSGYYYTTSSIAFQSSLSSSLIPATGSGNTTNFSLGNSSSRWRQIYLSTGSSILFGQSGAESVTIISSQNKLSIGSLDLMTASVGFDNNPVILKNVSGDVYVQFTGSLNINVRDAINPVIVRKDSTAVFQINSDGITSIGALDINLTPITGGILYDGNNFYVGI